MKKSQVSSQFNWIFILIVGALFLLVFFRMSQRQSGTAETRISATALSGLSSIFESARTGTSLSTVVDTPELKIEFTCQKGLFDSDIIYSDYSIGGLSRKIPVLPTFVPGTLEGSDIVTWTLDWNMPFKIMNFLFLANSRTRFFFYFPDNTYNAMRTRINETFSKNIKHQFVSEESQILDYNDHYSIIVIFSENANAVTQMTSDFQSEFEQNVKILHVIPSSENFLLGSVEYYDKRKEPEPFGKTSYFGLASFYGAVFSPDKEFYECSMMKARERFERVACIYLQKYTSLREKYGTDNADCRATYQTTIIQMQTYFGNNFCTRNNDDVLSIGTADPFMFNNYERELSFFRQLSLENRNSMTRSCELLY